MRYGVTPELVGALQKQQIVTGLAARLEFKSETIFVWTGASPVEPAGSGDSLLDGNRFEPMADGVVIDTGSNNFTLSGSDELTLTLAIPADISTAMAASQVYANEYQSRPATIWRFIFLPQADPLTPPILIPRKIRSGAMDRLEVTNDGAGHKFSLTIESHQAYISSATGQTYLNQKKYDAADTSQDFAVSIANGDPAPAKGTNMTYDGSMGYGGYGGGGFSGMNVNLD